MSGDNPKKQEAIRKRQEKAKSVILEVLSRQPVLNAAFAKAGISRATYNRWLREDSVLGNAVDAAMAEGRAFRCDAAESKLYELVNQGDGASIRYILSHLHTSFKKQQSEKPVYVDFDAEVRRRYGEELDKMGEVVAGVLHAGRAFYHQSQTEAMIVKEDPPISEQSNDQGSTPSEQQGSSDQAIS